MSVGIIVVGVGAGAVGLLMLVAGIGRKPEGNEDAARFREAMDPRLEAQLAELERALMLELAARRQWGAL